MPKVPATTTELDLYHTKGLGARLLALVLPLK